MKILFQSMMRPFRGNGIDGGVMGARLAVATGGGRWPQAMVGGSAPRRAYPPPVYRREEDLYVIGEHAGVRRTADQARTARGR